MLGKQTKRVFVMLAVAAAIVWFVVDTVRIFVEFFYDHQGLEFYSRRPYLLAVCFATAAVVVGAFAAIARMRTSARKRRDRQGEQR